MRLELIGGTSRKFWEIETTARTITVHWGRIGTRGRRRSRRSHPRRKRPPRTKSSSPEKLAKGYRDPAAKSAPVATAAPRNAALEAAIRADRDDPAPVAVYADWLQGQGSAVGELIALAHGKQDARKRKRANAIVKALDLPGDKLATYGWRSGLWQWLRLENSLDWMDDKFDALALARALFAQPLCAALDELRIGILRWDHNHEDVPAVLAEAGAHAWAGELRRLRLGDVTENIDMAHHVIGVVGPVISKTFPRLTSLVLHSGVQDWRGAKLETFGIGRLDLPALTELTIETCALSKRRLADVLAAKLPRLARLELWFGSADQGANCKIKDLAPLLGGKLFPKLTALGLRNCELADAIATALPASAIAARLESLDLSMGCLSDAGAQALADGASAFERLATLNIDDNFLSAAGIRQVKAAFKGKTVIAKDREGRRRFD